MPVKIGIIEDDEALREGLSMAFGLEGYDTVSAGTLREGEMLLKSGGMDAVVHAAGAVDEGHRAGGGAGQRHGGEALDGGVHTADAGDDQADIVLGALHIIILQALVESAEAVRIANGAHGGHGSAVFRCGSRPAAAGGPGCG